MNDNSLFTSKKMREREKRQRRQPASERLSEHATLDHGRGRRDDIAILTAILEGDDVVVVVIAVATPACGCHKYASERKRGDYAHTLES